MRVLSTLAELDAKLDECRLARAVSDDALRAVFAGFTGRFVLDHPVDPFSGEYRRFQMRLYERFARRVYTTANEATLFDVDANVTRPFPYATGSAITAGQHLGAVAYLLRCLRLQPGASVLEFGAGWGNTTIPLAQLGFRVTAVDVDPRFCELLRRRAQLSGVEIDVIESDFFWAEQCSDRFDAVVFFECFHHCEDHLRLLQALHRIVADDGRVYFGAEPILADYPVPWGLRMDGEALWAIGTHGWLELGFRESYFRTALARTGWIGRPSRSVDLPWISVWEASRHSGAPIVVTALDARLGTMTGRKTGSRTAGRIEIEAETDGYGVFGPHVPLPAGSYRGVMRFTAGAPLAGALTLDVCCERGVRIVAASPVDTDEARTAGFASVDFALEAGADEVEVRLFAVAGAVASVDSVIIETAQQGQDIAGQFRT